MSKKFITAAAVSGILLAGAGTGIAVGISGAGATDAPTTTTIPGAKVVTPQDRATKRTDRLKTALDPLVKDGTINQSQEDKVIGALSANQPKGGAGGFGKGGPGRGGRGMGILGLGKLDDAAKALGIDITKLKTDIESGKTIAEIAKDQGVDLSKVTQAITDAQNGALDQAVKDGRLTQAQADKTKSDSKQRIDDFVNGKMPAFGMGGPGHGGPGGRGGPGHDGGPDSGGGTTAPSTTIAPTTTAPAAN